MQSVSSVGLGHSGPRAYRVNDACNALGISRSLLYKLAKANKIRLVRVAGRTLVPATEIDRVASEGVQ